MFNSLRKGLGDLIFPNNCILCQQYLFDHRQTSLCPRCRNAVAVNRPPFCLRCSRPVDAGSPDGFCASCHKHPVHFDVAWGAYLYNDPMRQLLHQFKYHSKTLLRRTFSDLLNSFIRLYNLRFDAYETIVPIPLHPTRLRERGFNQAELIASGLSVLTGLPLSQPLSRWRPTPQQALLGQKERWTNLHGAFKMNYPFKVEDRSIVLVDDLLTTGATCSAAASALKAAGARRVAVVTLAIAP